MLSVFLNKPYLSLFFTIVFKGRKMLIIKYRVTSKVVRVSHVSQLQLKFFKPKASHIRKRHYATDNQDC